ncbi:hypothetical protein [Methylobacillus sp.]|uniref:hypothetical protein n=1 Tax=Methylobacillus sp. TaxID=56818 RepID=UPI002FDF3C63
MKKQIAIDRFLDEFEAQNITQETLNALYFHLSHGQKGRPENYLRPSFMLAARAGLTVAEIASLTGKDEREIQKYVQKAKEKGWKVLGSSNEDGEIKVIVSGKIDWGRQKNIEVMYVYNIIVGDEGLLWKREILPL